MKIIKRVILAVFLNALFCHGELYVPGAELTPSDINEYVLSSSTEPNGGGYGAGIWVDVNPSTYLLTVDELLGGTAGVGHTWYSVVENTAIDASFALNTTPFYTTDDPNNFSGEILMTSQPFMIAFWLDATNNDIPDSNDVFGWSQFTYDGSNLNLVDSAAENDGVGIIAGQYQQVPEPATVLLFGLGGLGACLLRRNRQHEEI